MNIYEQILLDAVLFITGYCAGSITQIKKFKPQIEELRSKFETIQKEQDEKREFFLKSCRK